MRQSMVNLSAFVVILSIMLGLAGCEWYEDASVRNPSSPGDAALMANFGASLTSSDRFGIALGTGVFRVRTLPGDYLLTYTTWLGTFYIPFRADETVKLTIGLQSNDTVLDVTLQPGTLTDVSQGTTVGEGDPVIALLGCDGGPLVNWQGVFSKDMTRSVVVLAQRGLVVESDIVEDLTGGRSDTFGVYLEGGTLQLYAPRGDYLVEYTTTYGVFHVVFRTISQRFVTIPLQGGTLRDVSIQRGIIPYGFEPIDTDRGVKFYFWTGSSPTLVWSNVFILNIYLPRIILVQEGDIVMTCPFATIIVLPAIYILPGGFDPGSPGEFGDCGSIPAGALPPPGECKVWDPYLPAGQQGPPGACSCGNAMPGSCLVDHYGNAIRC